MKVFTNINENIPKNCVVTIGFFDGVHLGHKYLIQKIIQKASHNNVEELVITLWPHPAVVFGKPIKLLNSLEEKIDHFRKEGVKNLLVLEFNREIASLSAGRFINEILVEKLGASEVIMGYNNSFGNKESAYIDNIVTLIPVDRLEKFVLPGFEKLNSSQIRECLSVGNVDRANNMLGYNYYLSGKIVDGYKIGRKIGFPTANMELFNNDKLIPANGVYIIKVSVLGKVFPAMLNIGSRPSFNGNEITIEFHILDFDGDLYNEKVTIMFYEKIRDEIKFDNIDELIKQLELDKRKTKAFFS